MLRIYANSTLKTLGRWESWGVKFIIPRERALNAHPIIPWKITLVDLDVMVQMGRYARELGIKSVEKTTIIDLLRKGDRVVGAIGFDLITGNTIIFKAKAVIMANGNQNWGIVPMWSSGRGDGIAAAYRAGAKMRNAEFGSFIQIVHKDSKTVSYGAEDCLYNAQGENVSTRANLEENLRTVVGGVDLGGSQSVLMYLEVRDGKGPIYEKVEENKLPGSFIGRNLCCQGTADPPFYRPWAQKFWDRLNAKNRAQCPGFDVPLRESVPAVVGEMSPLYVDHNMYTGVPGLYAAGDICANGSAWSGAVPTPPGRNRGSGLMHAVLTAIIAAKSACEYAAAVSWEDPEPDQIDALRQRMYANLNNRGAIRPTDMKWQIQNIMQPVAYTGYKREDRLQEALGKVLELKGMLPDLVARDPHELASVHECINTVLCAEMFFRASLARKESRGWHLREDYPHRDDKNFLKWIVIKDNNGEMELSLEDVPIERYKYKPE
jgi:succinate dehydrogenase/fumarate reductase flavoprotein subunit